MGKRLSIVRDFKGGLTEAAPDNILENELVEAQNAVPEERGSVAKCKGTVRFNEEPFSEDPIDVLIEFGKSGEDAELLAFSDSVMRNWDGTVIKDDLPGPPTDWDIYNDKLWWLDGEKYWVYNGETVEEATMADDGDSDTWAKIKQCTFIEQRGQRHFFAKADDNELYFSEVGDPTYIKGTNIIKAITDDDDDITGLKEFAGALLVFKRNSIFGWFGWDPLTDVRFDRLLVHKGTVSNKTIQRVEGTLVYLAEDGVYALTSLEPEYVSSVNITDNKISNVIRDAKNKETSCAVYFDRSYRLSLDNSESKRVEYRYYHSMQAWYGPFTHPINEYLVAGDGKLYSGSPDTGLIFEHEVGVNYDGEPIHFRIKTGHIDLAQKMTVESRVRESYFAFRQYKLENSEANVHIKIGYHDLAFTMDSSESLVWGKGSWGETIWGWSDLVVKQAKISRKGKRVQVTIENNKMDQPLTVYGFAFMYKPKRTKGTKFGVKEVAVDYGEA